MNKEISDATSNLKFIEETCTTAERTHSLIEKVIDHSLYLLNQKYNHLDAIQKLAANTPIAQKDYDELVQNLDSLSKDVANLSKKLDDLSFRSLNKR